jgi:chemotaxis family two-component system response regulator Rcp1
MQEKPNIGGLLFHIVLVEDTEPDALLVREALEQSGLKFDLRVLDDGEQGIDFVDALDRDAALACPDLFLLDLNLPGKTGRQILERVRQSPACRHVPVVIVTSSASYKDKSQATQLNAAGYFRKPSRLDEFMRLGPYVRDLLTRDRRVEPEQEAFAGL